MSALSLVIPMYNESRHLDRLKAGVSGFLPLWQAELECILVDDGSTDDCIALLKQDPFWQDLIKKDQVQILTHKTNRGKGAALQTGVLAARHAHVLTLDCDMSVRPQVLLDWMADSQADSLPTDEIWIGSRTHPKSVVHDKKYRYLAGISFNRCVRWLTGLPFKDTQCGCKLYPKDWGIRLFKELQNMGWTHDVELLLRAKSLDYQVREQALEWHSSEESKVSIMRDLLPVIRELRETVRRVKSTS